ncbi:MAG: hypothetical protein ACUVRL_00725 [Candidatus Saccharicenans sp.]|uniref:hypothetical protein n=1 Tax=Candidatus Saccharicenans sp. TaxID=2819258 RepID=UPI004049C426
MTEKELKTTDQAGIEAGPALQQVRQAEERARQLIEETRTRTAPELVRQAGEEAEELRKKILTEARQQAEKLRKEIIARARVEAENISQQTEAEKAEILRKAEDSFQQAVEKTVARLLEIMESRKV